MKNSNIYYNAMAWTLDGWYFEALRKNFLNSEKAKSVLLSGNSSSHWFIKHSVVAIMLCCVSAIICQQTVFGYELSPSLSLGTHHALLIFPLWVWAGQLFVALCSRRSYRLSLSYRDLLTVMSVLRFHILYSSSDIKSVSKYNWILNVYSNLSSQRWSCHGLVLVSMDQWS